MDISSRSIKDSDKDWIATTLKAFFGSETVFSRGRQYNGLELSGFIAEIEGEPAGVVLYHLQNNECKIIALASVMQGRGVGTKLLDYIIDFAISQHCKKIVLATTNDNTDGLRFYQKRGFYIVALHADIVKDYRKIKPEIPETGLNNIPLRDEIELEMELDAKTSSK